MSRTSNVEPTLAALVREAVRKASDGWLAFAAACGLFALIAALVWRPPAFPSIVCIALLAFAFGAYGIADRELSVPIRDHSLRGRRALGTLKATALVIGVAAGFALLLTFLTVALGTWIS